MVDQAKPQPPSEAKKAFPWVVVVLVGAGCLVVAVMIVGILAALLLPALADARLRSRITDCKNNLKQLGIYAYSYVSRYGGDVHYPPAPGQGFWQTLWTVPPGQSMVRRPGEDGLFLCKVYNRGTAGRSGEALDYTEPNFENVQAFPGGILSDRVRPDIAIGGDVVGADPNHGLGTDYNALLFDGSVRTVQPGGMEDQNYQETTAGDRVR